jgi:uncharacterized membrane protein
MSVQTGRRSSSLVRPKVVVFAAIGAMTAYVLYHNERFLIEPSNPVWQHYAQIAWWLIPHGVAGACALLLAPLQFSERLRRRYTAAHRIVGRVYVVGALVLAPLGAYIQYIEESMGSSRSFTVLAVVDAALLMSTTAVAFLFAMRRRITQHRQWMTRSYAVALVFFEGRLIGGITGLESSEAALITVLWTCLALALLFAEFANSFHEIRTAVAAPDLQPTVRHPAALYSLDRQTS